MKLVELPVAGIVPEIAVNGVERSEVASMLYDFPLTLAQVKVTVAPDLTKLVIL